MRDPDSWLLRMKKTQWAIIPFCLPAVDSILRIIAMGPRPCGLGEATSPYAELAGTHAFSESFKIRITTEGKRLCGKSRSGESSWNQSTPLGRTLLTKVCGSRNVHYNFTSLSFGQIGPGVRPRKKRPQAGGGLVKPSDHLRAVFTLLTHAIIGAKSGGGGPGLRQPLPELGRRKRAGNAPGFAAVPEHNQGGD